MKYKKFIIRATEQVFWLAACALAFAPQSAAAEIQSKNWVPSMEELKSAEGLTDPAFSKRFGGKRLEFTVEGHRAFIIFPTVPAFPTGLADDVSKPWVWFFPTYILGYTSRPSLPCDSVTWIAERLLTSGFVICGVDVGYSVGNPEGNTAYTKFYDMVVSRFNLSRKSCLMPVSQGGAMGYNWAIEHPQWVQCIAAVYPATDMRAYPGLEIASKAYGMPIQDFEENLSWFNPIDRLEPLAKARVPIFHIHGNVQEDRLESLSPPF